MDVMHACKQVRCRNAHLRETRSIRTTTRRTGRGLDTNLPTRLARHVDRPTEELSPIEHGVLLVGAYELKNCLDVPYKVAINEAVELAKAFGGTDGHKYVNGVLDRTAADLRPAEVTAARGAGRR